MSASATQCGHNKRHTAIKCNKTCYNIGLLSYIINSKSMQSNDRLKLINEVKLTVGGRGLLGNSIHAVCTETCSIKAKFHYAIQLAS